MRILRRMWVLALLGAVAAAGVAVAGRMGPSERMLIPKARRIAPWYRSEGTGMVRRTNILTETSIFQVEFEPPLPRTKEISLFDVRNGGTRSLSALSTIVRRLE